VKRFTLHTDVFTRRSKFLAAARKPEWVAEDSTKPVDLSDEDPHVFQAYLNCVYTGPETLEETPESFERIVLDNFAGFPDIFLHNLYRSVTKEQLIAKFEGFGEIKECEILGHNPPFRARISFTTPEAGAAAIKACDGL
jgi:hypothetical protein